MANADPPHKVDNRKTPGDRDIDAPYSRPQKQQIPDRHAKHEQHQKGNRESNQPELLVRMPQRFLRNLIADTVVGLLRPDHFRREPQGRHGKGFARLGQLRLGALNRFHLVFLRLADGRLVRQGRIAVLDLGQIGRARTHVQLSEHGIVQRLPLEFPHPAPRRVQVPKDNCLGRTSLLAGRLDFSVPDPPVLFLRGNARRGNALDTIGAFFHHPAPAHGDFGVVHRLEIRRLIVGVTEEIKTSYFVGTVVGAKPRSDATLVNLHVQSLAVVDRRLHRADQFAGRMFAMHARHRRVVERRVVQAAAVISIHANPVHFAVLMDLLFTDDGDVVFHFTGDHAGVAADAGGKIDGHPPLVTFVGILISVVERLLIGRRLHGFLNDTRVGPKLLQSRRPVDLAFGAVEMIVGLRRHEQMTLAGGRQFRAGANPRNIRRPQRVGVKSDARADTTHAPAAIAQVQRDRVRRLARHDPDRPAHRAPAETHFHHVPGRQSRPLSQGRADQHRVVPR